MYCEELDRLLDTHSSPTLEYFRQNVRTQGWYASREEWARECQKLQAAEQEMDRVAADVVDRSLGMTKLNGPVFGTAKTVPYPGLDLRGLRVHRILRES